MKKIALGLFLIISTAAIAKVANQVYRLPSSGPLIATYGAVNLASSAAVTGILPLGNGGTGIATCASGAIAYSDGTSLVCDTSKFSINTSTGVVTFQNGTTATYRTTTPSVNRLDFSTAISFSNAAIIESQTLNTAAVADHTSGTANYIVVSPAPSTNGLKIIRGSVHYTGAVMVIDTGEGFSAAHTSTGLWTITFTTQFEDTPVCTMTYSSLPSNGSQLSAPNAGVSSFQMALSNSGGSGTDTTNPVNFICIGQRKTGT